MQVARPGEFADHEEDKVDAISDIKILVSISPSKEQCVRVLCSKSTSAGHFKVQLGNHSDCEPGGRTSLTILFPGRSETSPPMSPASPHI